MDLEAAYSSVVARKNTLHNKLNRAAGWSQKKYRRHLDVARNWEVNMSTQRKRRPEWLHYALATGVSLLVALMIASLGAFMGH